MTSLNIQQILELLPHRPPMILVDRILELEPGVRAVGLKAVTMNEPFFVGHFPGQPVMPGVIILEAMAQVAGLILLAQKDYQGMIPLMAGVEGVRFRKPVFPGDTLITTANLIKQRGRVGRVEMVGRVNDDVIAECIMVFAIRPAILRAENE